MQRDRPLEAGADVGHAEVVDEELGELADAGHEGGDVRLERRVAGLGGEDRVVECGSSPRTTRTA